MIDELTRKGVVVRPYDDRGGRYGSNGRYGHDEARGDWDRGRHDDGRRGQDRGKRHRLPDLPAQCIRRIEKPGKDWQVLPSRCLERNDISTRRLPERCEASWPSRQGRQEGFALGCLQKAGYEVSRRR